ncbi:Fur family transcriptional regulator [Vibrio mexicanus]|uniref:Fur family transcriptional regulator n=1 Tax=Vibrio mexicanus TaxID=1004326 RepID=UPI00063C5AE5|nr:transcriptional repressor [Vibrio mexicanus]
MDSKGTCFEALLEKVKKKLKEQGKTLTATRRNVLYTLLHAKKPLSAYELVDYAKENCNKKLQAMSVYRSLEFLESLCLVHKLNSSHKYIVCEHIDCDHEHKAPQFLICSECNKISEQPLESSLILDLKNQARKNGFTVMQPQLEINCICDDCLKQMPA